MHNALYLEEELKKAATNYKVVILTGAKRIGKRSMISRIFPEIQGVRLLYDLDNYYRRNPDSIVNKYSPPMAIYDIQFLPTILIAVKKVLPRNNTSNQFILTTTQVNQEIRKYLADFNESDYKIIEVPSMLYEEYNNKKDIKNWLQVYLENPLSLPNRSYSTNNNRLEETLWKGSLPEALSIKEYKDIHNFLLGHIKKIVKEDMLSAQKIKRTKAFTKFFLSIANFTAKELNRSYLSKKAENVSSEIIVKWLNALTAAQQLHQLDPFKGKTTRRIINRKKGFLTDTGIACCLNEIHSPAELIQKKTRLEHIFYTYCANKIISLTKTSPYNVKFFHWLTSSNSKVDIVLQVKERVYPVVFRLEKELKRSHANGIYSFYNTYDEYDVMPGAIIYTGNKCYRFSNDIIAIPWNMVLHE